MSTKRAFNIRVKDLDSDILYLLQKTLDEFGLQEFVGDDILCQIVIDEDIEGNAFKRIISNNLLYE